MAVEAGSEEALRGLLREEVDGRVFSFPLVRLSFCEMLLDELQAYEASGLPVQRPNSMNNVCSHHPALASDAARIARSRPHPVGFDMPPRSMV